MRSKGKHAKVAQTRKPSPREEANMPRSRKQGPLVKELSQTGKVTTKLKSQPGPLP